MTGRGLAGCTLYIDSFGGTIDRSAKLWSKYKSLYIAIPYVIHAALTINADGTYSFEYDAEVKTHFGGVLY